MKDKGISLIIEILLFLALIISLIYSIITNIKFYTEIIIGLLLITMSYNNQKHFKRKYMTIIYLIFGIIAIVNAFIK